MNKVKSIFKELKFYKPQVFLFILCIVFSLTTFITVDSLKYSVEDYTIENSKTLAGGDIIFDSRREYIDNVTNYLNQLKENPKVTITNSKEFTAIAYSIEKNDSLLIQARIVDENYPLYGEVEVENPPFNLRNNTIVAAEGLFTYFNIEQGSKIKLGNHTFTLANKLVKEPDSTLNLFQLGPKVIIPQSNEEQLNLVGDRSRIEYKTLIKVEDELLREEIYTTLNTIKGDREDVNLYNESNSSLERFITNFLFFIKLIIIFIILITGIGISSIIKSLFIDLRETIAIKKVLGETSNTTFKYYLTMILMLILSGFIISIIASFMAINYLPILFENILPDDIIITLSIFSIIKGAIIGLIIGLLFTYPTLHNLKFFKPLEIFRKNIPKTNRSMELKIYLIIFLIFSLFIFTELDDIRTSLYIIGGSLAFLILIFGLSYLALKSLKKIKEKQLPLTIKLAMNSLFRPANKSLLIIFSIALSLTLIFSLSFLESNLQNNFVVSFPPDAPNLFIIDINPNIKENITQIVKQNITVYPMIRGNIVSVNNKPIEQLDKELGPGDSVTRTFSLTYGDLLESETIKDTIEPNQIFSQNWNKEVVQVSVLEEFAQRLGVGIGDRIVFNIQGVEIESEVVSIRDRLQEDIGAFFYFTFEEEVLKDAPQTIFATVRVDPQNVNKVQNDIIREFPAVTVIDAQKVARTVGDIISQLSSIVSFFTVLSLLGGLLILVSSIYATNLDRIKESVYYKLVGASKNLIRKVFILEYLIMGITCSLISIVFSYVITFLISTFIFDIDFVFLPLEGLTYLITVIITITLIGFLSIIKVVNKKPVEFIRNNNVE